MAMNMMIKMITVAIPSDDIYAPHAFRITDSTTHEFSHSPVIQYARYDYDENDATEEN